MGVIDAGKYGEQYPHYDGGPVAVTRLRFWSGKIAAVSFSILLNSA
jgi:hypothetical protein